MEVVKVYNCQVRLAGSLLHSVPKMRISGEEVRLLKTLHGDDAIVELKEIGSLDGWSRNDELLDLADRYSVEVGKADGRKLVEKVFGVMLNNFDDWLLTKELAEEDRKDEAAALQQLEQTANSKGTMVRSGATT